MKDKSVSWSLSLNQEEQAGGQCLCEADGLVDEMEGGVE